MKKRVFIISILLLLFFTLAGCDFLDAITQPSPSGAQAELESQETYKIYRLAASAGYEGTYDE